MITTDRQLKASKEKLEMLRGSLTSKANPRVNPAFQKAGKMQAQALVSELESQVARYEELRKRGLAAIKISSPADILVLPIEFRIAKHLTQQQFAEFVDVPLRQICRYELSEYNSINGETLKKILDKLSSSISVAGKVLDLAKGV